MALSGTISKSITGRTYKIEWSASQSVANNQSTITCKHYLVNNASYSLYIDSRSNTCTVDGTSKSFTSSSISTGGGSTIHLGTTTHTVSHNSDGSKSVAIKGVFNIQATLSGSYVSSITASSTVTLDTIPRKATIDSAPDFTDEDNPKITYTNKAGNSVTSLDACISFDGSNDDIPYRALTKTGSSYTFNLTDAERETLRQGTLSGSNSRTVKFYVRTVIGGNTFYSTLTKTLTITNATPTISPTVVDSNSTTIALTGDSSKLIRYHSNAAVAMNATFKKGASAKTYKITNGDKSLSTASGTFNKVEKNSFAFSVTDNRGLSASKTLTPTMVNYVHLTCNLEVNRPNALGEMTFKISGNYFNGSFGSKNNTLSLFYSMEAENGGISAQQVTPTFSGNTYSIEVPLTGLDYRQKYTFKAWAEDLLEEAETKEITTRTLPVFDWSGEDFNFNVPVTFSEGYIGTNKILASGASYMNETQTWNLSEPVSEQPNGIVLVFSGYDTTNKVALDSSINTFFVSKKDIELFPDVGHTFLLGINAGFSGMAAKYLYFTDTTVYGHEGNTSSGTNSGITFNNSNYVLRYVIGV